MLEAALRWIIPLAALLILGPMAGLLTAALHAPDGSTHSTILLNQTPLLGLVAVAAAFALATLAGVISSRLHGPSAGLFTAGLVLAWSAWGTGNIDQILRRTQSGSIFWTLAIEGAIVGVLGCLAAAVILACARRPANDVAPETASPGLLGGIIRQFRDIAGPPGDGDDENAKRLAAAGVAFILALGAAAIGAWLLARESLKGQTLAAAVVAGVLAAGIGHAGDQRARATLFFAVLAILAIAAPLAAALKYSDPAGAVRAAYASSLLPLARIMPLDWIAGAFLGIPIGISWAGSMLEKHPATA